MRLSQFDFHLPPELIAQNPAPKRDESRVLIVDRKSKEFQIIPFHKILDFIPGIKTFIFNNTKVFPARLFAKTPHGGKVEILLSEQVSEHCWRALAKPGKKLKIGTKLVFSDELCATVVEDEISSKIFQFSYSGDFFKHLDNCGVMPLPHYIERKDENKEDKERYQTIYAKKTGSIAAPTAGLHFTEPFFKAMDQRKIKRYELTLHVGLGTFSPIYEEQIDKHKMHTERYEIPVELMNYLNEKKFSEMLCVGTTSLRALESALQDPQNWKRCGQTNLFIQPGYVFKCVQNLLTNFHLPKSTLFILVSTLLGLDLAKKAYQYAIDNRMRFFSYGDAMLIL